MDYLTISTCNTYYALHPNCFRQLIKIKHRKRLKLSSIPPVNTMQHGSQNKSLWDVTRGSGASSAQCSTIMSICIVPCLSRALRVRALQISLQLLIHLYKIHTHTHTHTSAWDPPLSSNSARLDAIRDFLMLRSAFHTLNGLLENPAIVAICKEQNVICPHPLKIRFIHVIRSPFSKNKQGRIVEHAQKRQKKDSTCLLFASN